MQSEPGKPRARKHPSYVHENIRMISLAVKERLIDASTLSEITSQANDPAGNPFGRILIENRICSESQVRDLISAIVPKLAYCPQCLDTSPTDRPFDRPACPACGAALHLLEFDDVAAQPEGELLDGRYGIGRELGVGGLGRVLSGTDTLLGREVAIKELLLSCESEADVERFTREGRVAGRLTHPNIVPVFDVGTRESQDGRRPYFVMARIMGRDLSEIIRAVERGGWEGGKSDGAPAPAAEDDPRREFSRPRMLRIFQDVCRAIAYAHSRGVVHRDLKPANVMVGRYGEVYVVDWGLAKVRCTTGIPDSPDGAARNSDSPDGAARHADSPDYRASHTDSPDDEVAEERRKYTNDKYMHSEITEKENQVQDAALTLNGTVLGTPAYMPPEQADGRVELVDELSDVYSLGAMLYEILTFRPPFEGDTGRNVIEKALSSAPTPPSVRASQTRRSIHALRGRVLQDGARVGANGDALQAAPDALSAPTAAGCGQVDAQANWPEPVPQELEEIVLKAMARDRSKRYPSAMELHEDLQRFMEGEKERERNRLRALAKLEQGRGLVARMDDARAQVKALEAEAEERVKEVKPNWPIELKRELWALEDRIRSLQDEVVKSFTEAGRSFQAALEFERGNEKARSALADLYWAQYLREEQAGDRAEMIHCAALVREFDGGRYGALLKGDGALTLSVVRYKCPCLRRVEDARWNVFFDTGRMVPPSFGSAEFRGLENKLIPAAVTGPASAVFGHGSDCRPVPADGARMRIFRYEEEDRRLVEKGPVWEGVSPAPEIPLAMGSYLVRVEMPGCVEVRCPVRIGRAERARRQVTLYSRHEVPKGWAVVPAGVFIEGGDSAGRPRKSVREIPYDYFVSVHPVTCGEYLEFLNDIAASDADQARRMAPRAAPSDGQYWPMCSGRFELPTAEWMEKAGPDAAGRASRLTNAISDWSADWPVLSISWNDAIAYSQWRSRIEGRLLTLPTEEEREKAARGADGRAYPTGEHFDATWGNVQGTFDAGVQPVSVLEFPLDESPYGIRGMGGNSQDWCLNDAGETYRKWRCLRGGSWAYRAKDAPSTRRWAHVHDGVFWYYGLRLVFRSIELAQRTPDSVS